jgi:peptide/nickel transport system substrate-binding protein
MKTMKKFLIITSIAAFLVGALALDSFSEQKPIYGGTLRVIRPTFPKVIGYPPEFSPVESICALPVLERLNEWDEQGHPIPVLAESWEGDPVNKTVTWHLRKGVKFTDGTDWNAEALRWNYQIAIDAHRQTDGKYVKSMEVVDDHTLKMYLSDYNYLMTQENLSWRISISPTAFKKAAGGDFEKGKEWARTHSVGTGPFKVVDFQRDSYIKYARNDNYWRKGMPYLDGIESRLIQDPMTAQAIMEAGEADVWMETGDVQNILTLEDKGFTVNWGPGMFYALLPNSSDPKSPYANKKVREALEYAIDRPAIARMVGFGKYEALQQLAPAAWPGYVQGYNPRPYNPEKAKKLLAEAGYPNGFKTAIMTLDRSAARDGATAIKAYLEAVGLQVRLDVADLGRYFGSVFHSGWSDLVFAASGINPSTTDLFIHFGPEPMTYRTGNIYKTPEYLQLCEKALHTYDEASYLNIIKQIVVKAGEDAMVIPVYRTAQANVQAPYVHSNGGKIHSVIWYSYEDWMEPH